MKKKKEALVSKIFVAILAFTLFSVFYSFAEERITLTTYYPAPYGVYKEMRANAMAIGEAYRYYNSTSGLTDGTLIVSGSVGIGTTSPSGKLDIVLNAGGDSIEFRDAGTDRTKIFFNEGGTGDIYSIFYDGAGGGVTNKLKFVYEQSGPLEILTMDGNGNVGIGTTEPQAKLEVDGAIRIPYLDPRNRSSDYEYIRFGAPDEYWAGFMHNIQSATYGDGDDFVIFTYGNRDIVLRPGSGDTIFKTGNVGIGTTSPSSKLEVAGWYGRTAHGNGGLVGSYNNVAANSAKTNPIYVIGSSYKPTDTALSNMYGIGYSHTNASFITDPGPDSWGMYVAADGDARIFFAATPGGSSYFNAGNVGIGTANPDSKLHIKSTASTIVKIESGSTNVVGAGLKVVNPNRSYEVLIDSVNSGSNFRIHDLTATTTRFLINSSGNVGIGTEDPRSKLDVRGSSNTCVKVTYTSTSGIRRCPTHYHITRRGGNAPANYHFICCRACLDVGGGSGETPGDGICD